LDASSTLSTQLTFAVYNAYVKDLTLPAPLTIKDIQTDWVLVADDGEEMHLDIWADNTPDASPGGTQLAAGGKRMIGIPTAGTPDGSVIPELPVRDDVVDTNPFDVGGDLLLGLNDGTYYDRFGPNFPELAFAGDPADDDEVWWSFISNPESPWFRVTETFNVPGESFVDAATGITVYTAGPSNITDPDAGTGLGLIGQFIPGSSLISPLAVNTLGIPLVNADGTGKGNNMLVPGEDYQLTGQFLFGGENTGAWDSDYNTFTFQNGEPGSVGTLTQLKGPLVPEPVTMAGLMLGVGSLLGYVRKRR
jgi:hypothetical protein